MTCPQNGLFRSRRHSPPGISRIVNGLINHSCIITEHSRSTTNCFYQHQREHAVLLQLWFRRDGSMHAKRCKNRSLSIGENPVLVLLAKVLLWRFCVLDIGHWTMAKIYIYTTHCRVFGMSRYWARITKRRTPETI